jgi:hypothetical protein
MSNSTPTPLSRRVLSIIHAPRLPVEGGRKLWEVLRWRDPDDLAQKYIADVRAGSYGLVNFEMAERVEVDGFPVKKDGFVYTPEMYLACWRERSGFHQPDAVDYHRLLAEFDIVSKINSGAIDEVWLFGFPYAGYYESIMAGPGAFWCNAPPLGERVGRAGANPAPTRRFVIMGFNYERGVGEMLEDLGHRAESILAQVCAGKRGDENMWEKFTRYDQTHPGQAECGNVHFAPNSQSDYDWGSRRKVASRCDDWLNFPNSLREGVERKVDCRDWGNGDIRLHHLWWFKHFPHVGGETNGVKNNWWEYVVDANNVK